MANVVRLLRHNTTFPLLTTWRLWRKLRTPGEHPLYWRTLARFPFGASLSYSIGLAYALIAMLSCGVWQNTATAGLSVTALFIGLLLVSSVVYAVVWMIGISTAINRVQRAKTYETFAMTPAGTLGASWAIGRAVLHHHNTLSWIDLARKIITISSIGIVFLLLLTTLTQQRGTSFAQFIDRFLEIVILIAASYVEHVQSIVIGSLIGMLVPTYSRIRFDVHLWAVILFVALHTFSYVAALVVAQLYPTGDLMLTLTTSLLAFYTLREGFIVLLWRMLAYRLNEKA